MYCPKEMEGLMDELMKADVVLFAAMGGDAEHRARLVELGIAAKAIEMIEAEVEAQVDEATEIAKASGLPSLDMIETQVWADGGSAWRN